MYMSGSCKKGFQGFCVHATTETAKIAKNRSFFISFIFKNWMAKEQNTWLTAYYVHCKDVPFGVFGTNLLHLKN